MSRKLTKLTVSQCPTHNHCQGYNKAVEEANVIIGQLEEAVDSLQSMLGNTTMELLVKKTEVAELKLKEIK